MFDMKDQCSYCKKLNFDSFLKKLLNNHRVIIDNLNRRLIKSRSIQTSNSKSVNNQPFYIRPHVLCTRQSNEKCWWSMTSFNMMVHPSIYFCCFGSPKSWRASYSLGVIAEPFQPLCIAISYFCLKLI